VGGSVGPLGVADGVVEHWVERHLLAGDGGVLYLLVADVGVVYLLAGQRVVQRSLDGRSLGLCEVWQGVGGPQLAHSTPAAPSRWS